ncbi:hypothetical protein R0131_13960 [Clostridium sp. AL.422]|uniref:hypothetical protein n=1 Tax=Clostridium TaxID=1485 RepID=UPI00293DE1F9|nr:MULTISPECIES: hypothetical protein [unclassified Clostridium]MDV4151928.1 hypothetical protein [Clostridium sp. AL.422]
MGKLSEKKKRVLCYLGLAITFLLMGNSNNVPDIFVERIFKPITGDSWRISYSGLIIIIGIYYCLRHLNEIKENSLIRTTFRRVIVTILLIYLFTSVWTYCIKFYKGFFNDLNSIYIDREKTLVNFYGSENELTIGGEIEIENCSDDTREFYIKIKTPYLVKDDINKEYVTLEHEFKLNEKEIKTIIVNEELKFDREPKYSGYSTKAYEYILFNDKDQVIFQGTFGEYQSDDWISKKNYN